MRKFFIYVAAALFAAPTLAFENNDTTSILSTLHSETLQASKEARPQTLQECLEKGLQKNYSLRIIRNEERRTIRSASSATRSRWRPIMPPWRMLVCFPR